MSTTTKKTSAKGVRYTDAQKKEVVDFANSYNTTHGRGGQSKAAAKFNISQLTVATWLKASGAPASKSAAAVKATKATKTTKAVKAVKSPAAKGAKGKLGLRYTDEQKKALTDFVVKHNEENGRGGPSMAAKKFGVSPLTVTAWLKAAGLKGSPGKVAKKGAKKAAKATKAGKTVTKVSAPSSGGFSAKLSSLLSLSGLIDKAEAELAQLKARFNSLKASL